MPKIFPRFFTYALAAVILSATLGLRVAGADDVEMFPQIDSSPGAKFIAIQLGMTALELKKVALAATIRDPAKSARGWSRKYVDELSEQIQTLNEVRAAGTFDVVAQAHSIEASLRTLPEQMKLQEAIAEYRHYKMLLTNDDLAALRKWANTPYQGFNPNIFRFRRYFRKDGSRVESSFALHAEERRQLLKEAAQKITAADLQLTQRLTALGEPRSTAFIYSAVGRESQLQRNLERLGSSAAKAESRANLILLERKLQSTVERRAFMLEILKTAEDPALYHASFFKRFSDVLLVLAAYDVSVRFYELARGRDPGFFPGKRVFDAAVYRFFHGKSKATLEPTPQVP